MRKISNKQEKNDSPVKGNRRRNVHKWKNEGFEMKTSSLFSRCPTRPDSRF